MKTAYVAYKQAQAIPTHMICMMERERWFKRGKCSRKRGNYAINTKLTNRSHQSHKFIQCEVSNIGEMGHYRGHHRNLKHQ